MTNVDPSTGTEEATSDEATADVPDESSPLQVDIQSEPVGGLTPDAVDPKPLGEPTPDADQVEQTATSASTSQVPAIKDVRSLEGLLRYAYSRSARFSIPRRARDAIANEDGAVVDLRPVIEGLAEGDDLLRVPVRLLAAVDRSEGSLKFRRRCLSATAFALLTNRRLAGVQGLDLALTHPDQGDPTKLVHDVARALRAPGTSDGARAERKDPNKGELVENGVSAIALFFAIQREREFKEEDMVQVLGSVLWAEELQSARDRRRESTKALLVEASPAALGAAMKAWNVRIEEATNSAESADRFRRYAEEEKEAAEQLKLEAETESDRLRSLLAQHEAAIVELKNAIAQEQQARRVQSSHAIDDYESLRTRVIRLLDRQLGLLEDGLHALRNGSTSVTEEFLERVIESFVTQLETLREVNSPEGDKT